MATQKTNSPNSEPRAVCLQGELSRDEAIAEVEEKSIEFQLGTPLKDDPNYAKYFKMLKVFPMDVVKHKMRSDGLDPTMMDLDHNKSIKSQLGTPLKDDPEYKKYFKMQKILPMDVVKHKMRDDGKDPGVMDLDPNKSLKLQQQKEKDNDVKKNPKKKKKQVRPERIHWKSIDQENILEGKDLGVPEVVHRSPDCGRYLGFGSVHKNKEKNKKYLFHVVVPEIVRGQPDGKFQVYVGSRIIEVACPRDCYPGQLLQITGSTNLNIDVNNVERQIVIPINPNVEKDDKMVQEELAKKNEKNIFISQEQLLITCPPNPVPGMVIQLTSVSYDKEKQFIQLVDIPKGVKDGQKFILLNSKATKPGWQKIWQRDACSSCLKIKWVYLSHHWKPEMHNTFPPQFKSIVKSILLAGISSSNKECPVRKIPIVLWKNIFTFLKHSDWQSSTNDKRFVYMIQNYDNFQFNMADRGYVLKQSPNDNMQTVESTLSLIPISDATADSNYYISKSSWNFQSYVMQAQGMNLKSKLEKLFYKDACKNIVRPDGSRYFFYKSPHQFVLSDYLYIATLPKEELRKSNAFVEEISGGGGYSMNPFIKLVCRKIFDPAIGLWQTCSSAGHKYMKINPLSGTYLKDHLTYYRFFGRIMGMMVLNGYSMPNHLVPFLYKYILAWPVLFDDLYLLNEECYLDLKKLETIVNDGGDVSKLGLAFTTVRTRGNSDQNIELVKNGTDIGVTNENLSEYLDISFKHHIFNEVKLQMRELICGFYDVIPKPLLIIFNPEELECLMTNPPSHKYMYQYDYWLYNDGLW